MVKQRGVIFLLLVLVQSMFFYPATVLATVNGVAPDVLGLKNVDYKLDVIVRGIAPNEDIDITWRRVMYAKPTEIEQQAITTYQIEYIDAESQRIDEAKMRAGGSYAQGICRSNSGWQTVYHGDNNQPAVGQDIMGQNIGADFQGRINWVLRKPFKGPRGITKPAYFRVVALGFHKDYIDIAKKAGVTGPFPLTCSSERVIPPNVTTDGNISVLMSAKDAEGKALAANITIDGKRPTELGASKNTTTLTYVTKREYKESGFGPWKKQEQDPTKVHRIRFELDGYKPVEQDILFFYSRTMNITMGKMGTDEESGITGDTDLERDAGGETSSSESTHLENCGKYLGFQNVVTERRFFAFEPGRYVACNLYNVFTQIGLWIIKYAENVPY